MSTDKLQMGLFMCLLEQGDIFGPARFESITAYCVTSGVLGGPNYVQMINMLLLCSSGLILIPILQRTPDGGRVSDFYILFDFQKTVPTAVTFSQSFVLMVLYPALQLYVLAFHVL